MTSNYGFYWDFDPNMPQDIGKNVKIDSILFFISITTTQQYNNHDSYYRNE